jgi:hypothetical protein
MADDSGRSAAWGVIAVLFGGGAVAVWISAFAPDSAFASWAAAASALSVIAAIGVYMCFASLNDWPTIRRLRHRKKQRDAAFVESIGEILSTSNDQAPPPSELREALDAAGWNTVELQEALGTAGTHRSSAASAAPITRVRDDVVTCELIECFGGMLCQLKITNRGLEPALRVVIDSANSEILWAEDRKLAEGESRLFNEDYVPHPAYLPIQRMPSGSDVVLRCKREWGAPTQDLLRVTWTTLDGHVHQNEQSWSWTPR